MGLQNKKFSSLAILWESKNPEIATVDSQGKVIGIAIGDAIIEAVIDDVAFEFKIVVK